MERYDSFKIVLKLILKYLNDKKLSKIGNIYISDIILYLSD